MKVIIPVPLKQILHDNEDKKYASMKPLSYRINKGQFKVRGWVDLYVHIVRLLYDKNPYTLERMATLGSSFKSNGILDIGSQRLYSLMKSPIEISKSVFLETDLSALEIMQKIKYLGDYYSLTSFKLDIDFEIDHKISELKEMSVFQGKNTPEKSTDPLDIFIEEVIKSEEVIPVSFSIDKLEKKVGSWSDLHFQIIKYLKNEKADYLKSKVPKRFKDNSALCLGNSETYLEMERPYKIGSNLYLDLSSDPMIILNCINLLFDNQDEVKIKFSRITENLEPDKRQRTINLSRLNSLVLESKGRICQTSTPVTFCLKNVHQQKQYIGVSSSWKNLYFKIHCIVEKLYPQIYDNLIGTSLVLNDPISIGGIQDYQKMREPVQTSRNHLVEIDLSESQIVEGLINLLKECKISSKDLLINCIPINATEYYFSHKLSNLNNLDDNYLENTMISESTVDAKQEKTGSAGLDQKKSSFTETLHKKTESLVLLGKESSSFDQEEEKKLPSKPKRNVTLPQIDQEKSYILDDLFKTCKIEDLEPENFQVIEINQEDIKQGDSMETKRISFNYLRGYKNWKPYLLQVGNNKIEVQSWQTLETQIVKLLTKEKPKTLKWLSKKEESPSQLRLANTELKGKLTKPVQIAEDIYIDLGKDSAECLEILDNLISRIGFHTSNISVYLKRSSSNTEKIEKTSSESIKQETNVEIRKENDIDELSSHNLSEVYLEEIDNLEIFSSLKKRRLSSINFTWTGIPVAYELRDQNYFVHSWGELHLCIYKILLHFNPLLIETLNNLDEDDQEILGISKSVFPREENLKISDSESQENLYLRIETNREKIIRSLNQLFIKANLDKSSLLIYYVDSEEESVEFYKKLKENRLNNDDLKSQSRVEALELDIIEKDEYENTSPISFKLKGILQAVADWEDLYITSFKKLVENSSTFLEHNKNTSFVGGRGLDLTDESEREFLNKPIEIAPNLYLETELETGDIIRRLQAIIPECGIDFEDYSILVKPNEEANCEKENEETNDSKELNVESITSLLNAPTDETPEDRIETNLQKKDEESNEDQTESFGNEASSEHIIIETESTIYQSSDNEPEVDQDDLANLPASENKVEISSTIIPDDQEDSQRDEDSETSEPDKKEDFKPQIDTLITQYYVEESTIEEEQTSLNNLTLNQEMNQYILWMIRNGALNQDIHKSQFYFGILSQFLLDHGYIDQNLICIKDFKFLGELKEQLYLESDFQKLNFQNYNKPRQIFNDYIDYRRYS